jgi:hypothetical protein
MAAPYQVGDLVIWHDIELVVIEVKADGQIEAISPTMRVSAPPRDFTPASESTL